TPAVKRTCLEQRKRVASLILLVLVYQGLHQQRQHDVYVSNATAIVEGREKKVVLQPKRNA
ncbi:MAG: hypothetical protein Q9196_007303, partial [Gyalolechia fulgens]